MIRRIVSNVAIGKSSSCLDMLDAGVVDQDVDAAGHRSPICAARVPMSDRSITSGVAPISSATARTAAASRSIAITAAPSAANWLAIARPIPLGRAGDQGGAALQDSTSMLRGRQRHW